MSKYLFDTNIVTERKLETLPPRSFVSAVVMSELMTAAEADEYKLYQAVWQRREKEATLVVPTSNDWLPATRILHLLAQERKKKAGGKSPRRSPAAKQELVMDVLIAVSAARAGITVVTNDADFEAIRYHHKKLKL